MAEGTIPETTPPPARRRLTAGRLRALLRSRWTRAIAGLLVVAAIALGFAADYIARHAGPVLRERIVATLTTRFHSPVELDSLQVSVFHGIAVHGAGLRILYLAGPAVPDKAQAEPTLDAAGPRVRPMLSVREFTFRTSIRDLLHLRTRVGTVFVEGLDLHIPPHTGHRLLGHDPPHSQPALLLVLNRVVCHDAHILIETNQPGKEPLEFAIQDLVFTDEGSDRPLVYTADLTNPKPRGLIHATGHFGPWQGDDPRATAVDGEYTFSHADLSTIRGLGGMLASTGHFSGRLGRLLVDGTTTTPEFSLDVSNHPEPLTTRFHAIVDGTTGDTTLEPVEARLRNSPFTCTGTIQKVRLAGDGPNGHVAHDIALAVNMPHGRIEDLLGLGMKTQPSVMSGNVTLQARVHIPPGTQRVAAKMQIAGRLQIQGVEFSNPKLQDRIDSMSMRAQGMPDAAHEAGSDRKAEVASQMTIDFSLANALMTVPALHYQVPGAQVQLAGVYSEDGNVFEFRGHVRTEATASQMVTGWKAMLLKPFDRLLEKHGAGLELPISVSGTQGDVHFGLAMHGADETPQQMQEELQRRGRH